jgi:putative hydrolase of the HAD superfamily
MLLCYIDFGDFMKNVKVIAFDMDNTLIDRQGAFVRCVRDMIEEDTKKSIDDSSFSKFMEHFLILDNNGMGNKEILFNYYIEYFHLDLTWDIIMDRWVDRLAGYMRLMDDAVEVLDELSKRYRLAILTNGDSVSQRGKLNTFPHLNWFEIVMVAGDYPWAKPDVRIFELLCEKMNVMPAEVVFVGDTIASDIVGAKNAGMRTIWIQADKKLNSNLPDIRLHRLRELLSVL